MAKNNAVLKLKANIGAQRIALAGARKGEFKWTQDVVGGIYGNLASTIGGGAAALTGEQSRLMDSLRSLKQNQQQGSQRITNRSMRSTGNIYGSSTRASTRYAQQKVAQTGIAGVAAVAGRAAAGGILSRGNTAAMGTLAQGVQAAQAGAQAMTADALMYRAKNDASLIAQQQTDLAKMRLQNQLDIQNYKAKLALQDKAANGAASGAAGALANFASDTVPQLQAISNELFQANADGAYVDGKKPTGAEIASEWSKQTGYGLDTPQGQLVLAAANAVATTSNHNDTSPQAVSDAIIQTLAPLYPTLTTKQLDALGQITLKSSQNWAIEQAAVSPGGGTTSAIGPRAGLGGPRSPAGRNTIPLPAGSKVSADGTMAVTPDGIMLTKDDGGGWSKAYFGSNAPE